MLDQDIHRVRALAACIDDGWSRARIGDLDNLAALERDYWGRYWDNEIAASELVEETLALLRATPYSLAGDGQALNLVNAADRARFEELSVRPSCPKPRHPGGGPAGV